MDFTSVADPARTQVKLLVWDVQFNAVATVVQARRPLGHGCFIRQARRSSQNIVVKMSRLKCTKPSKCDLNHLSWPRRSAHLDSRFLGLEVHHNVEQSTYR